MPWYVNRHGERLWYEDVGAGCPVVLLHGWCMSSAVWKYQFEGLAGSLRIIAPDSRGHGRSRNILNRPDFVSFAEDLVDLVNYLKLQKIVLVGWSMGGQIALQAFSQLSEMLAGIVLVASTPQFIASESFPFGLSGTEAIGMRVKIQRNLKRALDGFHTRMFDEHELESHSLSSAIHQLLSSIDIPETSVVLGALDALAGADMRGILIGVDVPVLVMSGLSDRICTPEASAYMKNNVVSAELVVFPECGHAPFLTRQDQFNAEISGFIRRVCEQNTCS